MFVLGPLGSESSGGLAGGNISGVAGQLLPGGSSSGGSQAGVVAIGCKLEGPSIQKWRHAVPNEVRLGPCT